MILNCPQCSSRFLVADALIPPEGRTVRCGACTNQWFVTRPDDAPELPIDAPPAAETPPEAEVPVTEGVTAKAPLPPQKTNVPALKTKARTPKFLMIGAGGLLALWLVLAMLTYFPGWVDAPVVGSVYRMFGVTNTRGLAFAEVKMEREDAETKTRFILSGKIINRAEVARTLPIVHVGMKDKDGEEIWGRDYPVNVTLKPGEEYPFRIVNVETSFADRVTSLMLDIGNTLELMVR